MKTLTALLLFASLLTTSCSKDTETEIEGKWIALSMDVLDCPEDEKEDEKKIIHSSIPCEGFPGGECHYLEMIFNNGTFTFSRNSFSEGSLDNLAGVGTYTITGEDIQICEDGDCETFDIIIEDGILSLYSANSETFAGCKRHIFLQKA